MTLKEELEVLRGEPIKVVTGDPMDIPCIETSNAEKLCKHPVVSVNMITYNHEPYIRQAIEGVMMQKTDFEFELVIGEDASTDKTREICFEYQKKYPDKIRVLWWHENLYRNPHPAGGNGKRTQAHCRGEFIALCEGDDYWIDPLKLQKQVDVMRKYPNVGLCFCGSKIFQQNRGTWMEWDEKRAGFAPGLIPSRKYVLWTMFGRHADRAFGPEFFIMTATTMYRTSVLKRASETYELFRWRLMIGDSVFCIGAGSLGDVYYLSEPMSVYRVTSTGLTSTRTGEGTRDTLLVRAYYAACVFGLTWGDFPARWLDALCEALVSWLKMQTPAFCRHYMRRCCSIGQGRRIFLRFGALPYAAALSLGLMRPIVLRQCWRWMFRVFMGTAIPPRLRRLYEECEDGQV